MEKKAFRNMVREQLKKINLLEYEDCSYQISRMLATDPYWEQAQTVGITVSKHPEVDTWQIIRKGWEEGKRMVVPKCLPKSRTMVFRELTRFSQLESVYSGLFEPIESETEEVFPKDIDLLIVPGLAFTKKGYRLGVGGGYYDRFLQNYHGRTLSLAFSVQVVEALPIEQHDLPVQKIITENEVFHGDS